MTFREFETTAHHWTVEARDATVSSLGYISHKTEAVIQDPWGKTIATAAVAVAAVGLAVVGRGKLVALGEEILPAAGALIEKMVPAAGERVAAIAGSVKKIVPEEDWVIDAKALQSEYTRRQAVGTEASLLLNDNVFRLKGVKAPEYKMHGEWIVKSQAYEFQTASRFPIIGEFLKKLPVISETKKGKVIEQFNIGTGDYNKIHISEPTPITIGGTIVTSSVGKGGEILKRNLFSPAEIAAKYRWRRFEAEALDGKSHKLGGILRGRNVVQPGYSGDTSPGVRINIINSGITQTWLEDRRPLPGRQSLQFLGAPFGLRSDDAGALAGATLIASVAAGSYALNKLGMSNQTYASWSNDLQTAVCKNLGCEVPPKDNANKFAY